MAGVFVLHVVTHYFHSLQSIVFRCISRACYKKNPNLANQKGTAKSLNENNVEHNEYIGFSPICNIQPFGSKYQISIEIPGVNIEDIKIELYNGKVLVVNAMRKVHPFCIYQQSFILDDKVIDSEQVDVSIEHGILEIYFQKKEALEPVEIPIHKSLYKTVKPLEDGRTTITVLDVPGVELSNLKLWLANGRMIVEAERKHGTIRHKLRKIISLCDQDIDASSLRAFLMNGVLTVDSYNNTEKKKITGSCQNIKRLKVHSRKSNEVSPNQQESIKIETPGNKKTKDINNSVTKSEHVSSRSDNKENESGTGIVSSIENEREDKEWETQYY